MTTRDQRQAARYDAAYTYAHDKGLTTAEAATFATFACTDASYMTVATAYGAWRRIAEIHTNTNKETNTMPTTTKYPDIDVQLSGNDGNAYAILGAVQSAMRRGGVDDADVQAFYDEATTGDYDHLLRTAMAWVNVS